ncbi:hypothetical protein RhiirA4_479774 [Rhizophagus irregularis]|uniref:Uncharacterized protein n=1 Tax=Rhizophagus irregularis TaxID=588596 RepID=A0A2I1HGX5_9GLOM|nr:hypothetical protein RhiirA4_479774 [Rhizophagus irregularis]
MASSSTTNIFQALTAGDDLNTAVNRALYYEPVIHALKKYSSFGITEEDIARTVEKSTGDGELSFGITEEVITRTVEKSSGDGELYTNILIEHREALSTLGISDLQSLYHLLFLFYESFDFIQASVNASESVEDQPMDIEILETPKTPKHQSKVAAQQKGPMKSLSAKAIPFTPKGKQQQVSYADMVKQDPKDDVSRPTSPSPLEKKRKTVPVSQANNSRSPSKTTKKQPAAPSPKTISTVMTGYEPANKDLIQEITVYDIPSTWSQIDTLNHLKAWGQVVAIKFKSQQKYVTVTVLIELNQVATELWNEGVWTAPLGGLPVQWFLAKGRARNQLISLN